MGPHNTQSQLSITSPSGARDVGAQLREDSNESDTATTRLIDLDFWSALENVRTRPPLELDPVRKASLLSVLFADQSDDADGAR
jgi:hypothetical protein